MVSSSLAVCSEMALAVPKGSATIRIRLNCVAKDSSACRLELGAAREETCKASRGFTRSNPNEVDGWMDGLEVLGGMERGGSGGVGNRGGAWGGTGCVRGEGRLRG